MSGEIESALSGQMPEPPRLAMSSVLTGLLAAPFAWFAQLMIAETLAAQSCYPSAEPLSAPRLPWMFTALVALSIACLLLGVVGTAIAWRNLRRTGRMQWRPVAGVRPTRAELDGFLTRIAMMCSVLFLFALMTTDVALAIVSPCRGW
jgi:hypothetical protein